MALFGFSDISFEKNIVGRNGPLGALAGSQFERNTYRYPLDIGNSDKGHYLMIYIKQQDRSSFKTGTFSGGIDGFSSALDSLQKDAKTKIQNSIRSAQNKIGTAVGGDLLNKVNAGANEINSAAGGIIGSIAGFANEAYNSVVGGINNLFGQTGVTFGGNSAQTQALIDTSIKNITNQSFLKTTTLTTDAIALYMPDGLTYTYSQSYDQMELGNELGGKVLAAGGSAAEAFNSGQSTSQALAKAAASGGTSAKYEAADLVRKGAGGLVGENTARLGFTAVTGAVRNPMLEMIYKSPNFRTFTFDFV